MWNDNKVVMTVAYSLWLTSLKFLMEEILESADLMRKHLFNAFVGNIPKAYIHCYSKTLKSNPHIVYKPWNQQTLLLSGLRKAFQGFYWWYESLGLAKVFKISLSQTLKAWMNPQMHWIDLLRNQLIVGKRDVRVWASMISGIQTLKIKFSYVTKISFVAPALNGH